MKKILLLKNNLNISTKILLGSLIAIIFSTILSIFVNALSPFLFYIFGLWCLYFIGWLIYNSFLISKVKFNKIEMFTIGLFSLFIVVIYTYLIFNRIKLYQWDNANYYIANLRLFNLYDKSFVSGIKWIIGSTFKDNYGRFLLCFTSLLLKLSNGTEDAFVVCIAISLVIPTFIVFTILAKKIIDKTNVNNKLYTLLLCEILLATFPLLHHVATIGQPDIVGMLFVGIIIFLTIDYDFTNKDWYRYIILTISIICLLISRRWYMYWLLGYGLSYGIYILINTFKMKKKKIKEETFKNIFKFVIFCFLSVLVLLAPMFIRIIKQDFSSYTSWNLGGYSYEFLNQFKRLGLLYIIVMVIGILYGLKNKFLRKIILIFIFNYLIAFFAFVRIQNMGTHQSLILVPSYIVFFIFGILCLSSLKNKYIRNVGMLGILFILLSTFFGTMTGNNYLNNNLYYTSINMKPTKRDDYENIGKMVNFIIDNTTKDDKVYINSASSDYCAQTFSGYIHPDLYLTNIIPAESSIDASSGFPISSVAKSKYIFTTNIDIESTGAKKGHIVSTINKALNTDIIGKTKFELVQEFEISDSVTFYAYHRIKEFDEEEANYWKEALEEPNKSYPELFNNRIDNYLNNIKKVDEVNERE